MVNQIFRPGKSKTMNTLADLKSQRGARNEGFRQNNRFQRQNRERRFGPERNVWINWEGRRRYLEPMLANSNLTEYINHLKLEINRNSTYQTIKLSNIKTLGDIGGKTDIEFLDVLTRQGINDELKYAVSNAVDNIRRRCEL